MTQMNANSQSIEVTDSHLFDFMRDKLDSLAKWDLVHFFHQHPGIVGPAPRVASLTGRDLRDVQRELTEMASNGLLEVDATSGVKVYRLTTDKAVRAMISEFVSACDDRRFREEAIYLTMSAYR